jgi:IMP dehydrogenase
MAGVGSERKLSDIIDRHLVAVSPQTSINAARRLAHGSTVSVLPVLLDGKLIGVLSQNTLNAERTEEELHEPVEKIMEKPIFVEEKADAKEARKILMNNNLTRIPVVDSKSSMICIGTVSSTDLL